MPPNLENSWLCAARGEYRWLCSHAHVFTTDWSSIFCMHLHLHRTHLPHKHMGYFPLQTMIKILSNCLLLLWCNAINHHRRSLFPNRHAPSLVRWGFCYKCFIKASNEGSKPLVHTLCVATCHQSLTYKFHIQTIKDEMFWTGRCCVFGKTWMHTVLLGKLGCAVVQDSNHLFVLKWP